MFALLACAALAAPRLYHSVAPIVLPESGPVAVSAYMASLVTNQPHGLIVRLDKDGKFMDVLAYGWCLLPTNAAAQTADINHDGFVTGEDADLFRARFEAGDITADYDGDGFVTGEDFDAFTHDFEFRALRR